MKRIIGAFVGAVLGVQLGFAQQTPEAAIREFKEALEKGAAEQLVALLPPSYVKDISGLAQEFAGKMDVDIWNKLRTVIGDATGALGAKAEILVDMTAKDAAPVAADVKAARVKALQETMGAVVALMKHDITSLERLKTVDATTFAREVEPLFVKSRAAMQTLKAVDAAVPKADDITVLKSEPRDGGVVALTFAGKDGAAGTTEEFVQVEGRWVPKTMADDWSKGITDARDGLKELDFTSAEGQANKAQMLMMLGMFEPMIQQIAQVQSAEQLQGMLGGMLMPLMMMGGGGMGGGGMGGGGTGGGGTGGGGTGGGGTE